MQDWYRGALGIPSIASKDKRSQVQPDWMISSSFRHTPVSEPKAPVSEPKTPVAEPKAPVAEPKAPVSEPKAPVAEPKTPVAEPKRNLLIHRSDAAKTCRATARARPKEPYAPLVSLTVKRQNGA